MAASCSGVNALRYVAWPSGNNAWSRLSENVTSTAIAGATVHAVRVIWRDVGLDTTKGVLPGPFQYRVEAETMELTGYVPVEVAPSENASGGKGVACQTPASACAASFHFTGTAGAYQLNIQYFDQNNGQAKFRVFSSGHLLDQWVADDILPNTKLGGDNSTRRQISGVTLRPGDEIRIEGIPDSGELAALDYIEIEP